MTKRPGSSMIIESLRGTNAMKRKVACLRQGFFVEYVRTGRICRSRIGRLGNWRRSTPGSMAARLRSRIRLCFRAKRVRWFPWDRIADFTEKAMRFLSGKEKNTRMGVQDIGRCGRDTTKYRIVWRFRGTRSLQDPPKTKKRCTRRKTKPWHSRKKSESV